MTPEQKQEARAKTVGAVFLMLACALFFVAWAKGRGAFMLAPCALCSLAATIYGFRVAQLRGWLGR